ncbi:MAG: CRISPR-associated endonuclease Cas2 [Candidatus Staskawiczbacteria bacterium RIFCSPLOWO2_01_FULL_40_39]|uniref:CRISPR-associated endonuclease Cas2 n=1 Tax=Candidatus Staskawiczbacteria bacterium RIFCSPHIGHO2_01_FULL_39_25 TaxID=1802202 RepID=A0A1G2HNP1_9BACT|nr:MAG: CRISPR-associated endonuclease Cas2 [Candidatus Staskawiczbacteria bacterium RIFCSPHIGHO2_01_FULL_39_25]OGZ73922.1 MAG: CRISPR-associated endonuclease Cas2 [Candidatus Staskawiczbacteria bacterium RIFCSPLOWO2_01_FULL_40_39]OGZ76543.1 MAG: CRISPR-associated endonuclease Cas2 [Candidatus Staskawiczbacteria bacterium RIFCSPLOWO2_02_FULL_39_8]
MQPPVTDKFLWDLYNILDKTGDIVAFLTKRPTMYNSWHGIKNPVFDKYRKDKNKKAFSNLVNYAKRKNYIRIKNLEGNMAVMLTKEGLNKVLKASFIIEGKKKRDDGKWAMLIFDVPEKYRKSRDLLRSVLHNLGYKMFQQSVWITPYDVSDKTEKLLQMYNLDEFVKIFLIEEM